MAERKMIRLRLALAAILISLSGVQYAQSAIVNGRFETGDFSGWTLGPMFDPGAYRTITGAGFGLGPIEGSSSALMVSKGGTGVSPFDCSDFRNAWGPCPLPPGVAGLPITASGGPVLAHPFVFPAFLGPYSSWIGQDIQGQAGDQIDLSLQYMTNEFGGVSSIDNFDISATRCLSNDQLCFSDPDQYVHVNFALADFANCPQTNPNSALTGFQFATAPCDVRLTLPGDALWTLYISVIQGYGDNLFASGILVDNIRQVREVVPVPSPGTFPLLLLGIGLAGLARSSQRKAR